MIFSPAPPLQSVCTALEKRTEKKIKIKTEPRPRVREKSTNSSEHIVLINLWSSIDRCPVSRHVAIGRDRAYDIGASKPLARLAINLSSQEAGIEKQGERERETAWKRRRRQRRAPCASPAPADSSRRGWSSSSSPRTTTSSTAPCATSVRKPSILSL